VGWHVPKTLHQRIGVNLLNAETIATRNPVTTSHQRFKSRTASSYAILDSLSADNLYRIYPEQIFCSSAIKGRCITHNSRTSFYRDDDHLSDAGAALLIGRIVPILSTLK